jgi:hypothetical protein
VQPRMRPSAPASTSRCMIARYCARDSARMAPRHSFVDDPVVRHGGFPTHAAEQAEGFHGGASTGA